MKNHTKTLLATLAITTTAAISTNAGIVFVQYDFNTASEEGWTGTNITGLDATGDSLDGTASSNDPILQIGNSLNFTPTTGWDTLVFRVREKESPTADPLDVFNATGLFLQFNNAKIGATPTGVASGDGFFTVTYNISGFGAGTINSIRLDPIGGAATNSNSQTNGNLFEVDFIQLNEVPEPGSLALLAAGGLCMLKRRRRDSF